MNDYFIHDSSYVDDNVTIGKGTKIWHFCHVQSGAVIGENCSLGQNVNVGNNVKIGNGVRIQNNVSIYEGVEIEDNVFCGPSCVFTNVTTPRSHFPCAWRVCQDQDLRRCLVGCQLHGGLRTYGRQECPHRRWSRGDQGCKALCADGWCSRQANRLGLRVRKTPQCLFAL